MMIDVRASAELEVVYVLAMTPTHVKYAPTCAPNLCVDSYSGMENFIAVHSHCLTIPIDPFTARQMNWISDAELMNILPFNDITRARVRLANDAA